MLVLILHCMCDFQAGFNQLPGLSSSPFQGMTWWYRNRRVIECAVYSGTLSVKPTMLKRYTKGFHKGLLKENTV